MAVSRRGNLWGRLENLKARGPKPPHAPTGARARLGAMLERIAAARRGELGPREGAEIMADAAELRDALDSRRGGGR